MSENKGNEDGLNWSMEHRHVIELSKRIEAKCKKEGRDTFTFRELKEESIKMYEGK